MRHSFTSTSCCANIAVTEANLVSPMVSVAVVVVGVAVVETACPCQAESWLAMVHLQNAWPEGSSSTADVIAAH